MKKFKNLKHCSNIKAFFSVLVVYSVYLWKNCAKVKQSRMTRRVTSKRRTASRSKTRYSSSSESFESVNHSDESFSSSSSSSKSFQVRRASRSKKTSSSTGKRRQTKKKSTSGKKKIKSKVRKRSKLGKTSRRRRRRTASGSTFRKTKAKRRGGRSKKQKKALTGQLSSMSSVQSSLKTNASQVKSKDDSGMVLSLPITHSPRVDKVDGSSCIVDTLQHYKESVVPIVEVQGKLVDADEQSKSFSSMVTFDSSDIESPSPYSGPYSPVPSFQVTVNSSDLVDLVNQASSNQQGKQQSPTTVGVAETVSDLLSRVKADDQESEDLNELFSSRMESLRNFVDKVEADLCKAESNTSVDNDDVSSKMSLSSVEQILDHCYDCRSASIEVDSQNEINLEIGTSSEIDQMFPTLKEEDKNEAPNDGTHNFMDNGNSGNSLSLSLKSADWKRLILELLLKTSW